MTQRNRAMIRASCRISDYLECYSGIGIDAAIEFYIRDHYYPEMNVRYRKKFLKEATTKYPPQFAIQIEMIKR
jgi:hypothetical protein